MIVVDTSAIVGAHHAHYLPDSIKGFWDFFEQAWERGDLIVPRAVELELADQSDEAHRWIKDRNALIVETDADVQRRAGQLVEQFSFRPGADEADPFVIAEAEKRGFAVATYEGRGPTGNVARSKANVDNIPKICAALHVTCLQPGEAWRHAGLRL